MLIATRTLQAETDNGPVPVEIRVQMPVQKDEHCFECTYEIAFPEGVFKSVAAGADGLQALHLCQQIIGSLLYASAWHKSGRLAWIDGDGKAAGGYGFPVPRSIRDLLVGSDKIYEG
jgi:hypothetical protein